MPWTYEKGSDSIGVFPTRDEAERAAAKDSEFADSVKGYNLVQFAVGSAQVIPDIGEHFNAAFPVPVSGRRHLKALQKQFGTSDYEPSSNQKERDKYAKERLTFEREHRR